MGKRAPYLSGYFLLDRGYGSGSGTEDCPRAQGLFLLFLGEALEKKNGLDLVSRDGSICSWRNLSKRLKRQGPNKRNRIISTSGPKKGSNQGRTSWNRFWGV